MTKEQIKQILTDNFNTWGFTQEFFDLSADEILSLPLEVPSDGDVLHESSIRFVSNTGYFNVTKATYFKKGATWMRDEIIKRNK